jgi:hypothetical protein
MFQEWLVVLVGLEADDRWLILVEPHQLTFLINHRDTACDVIANVHMQCLPARGVSWDNAHCSSLYIHVTQQPTYEGTNHAPPTENETTDCSTPSPEAVDGSTRYG